MPGRKTPLINRQVYHLFNRGIDRRQIFTSKQEYQRGWLAAYFYHVVAPPLKLSHFLTLNKERQGNLFSELSKQKELLEIISFCFMPNHYHFLVRQLIDNGVAKFMSNFQNSYTRYFNTKHQRTGPLVDDQFKAVLVETDEQLLHLSRYIHLNPLTSYLLKDKSELETYPWSSFPEYLGQEKLSNPKIVLDHFRSKSEYKKFVLDQIDYQRQLKKIEHLAFD